jgi:LysW-gamma-L-lysine carboxypeptidase
MVDPVALLEAMVRIPSRSGDEAALAQFLVTQMRELGFDSFVDDAGNAVGIAGHGPDVVLLGHIDTVPGLVPVRIVDGRLYGRGAVDAKGPFATFIMAVAQLIATDALDCRYVVIGAVEEEAASSRGAQHAATCYQPVACVIGEPSGWDQLTLGYKGRLLIDAAWRQPGAHTAGPTPAVAERAVAYWCAVREYCSAWNTSAGSARFDHLLPALRHINTSSDGLTDEVTATIGIRLPPAIEPAELAVALRALDPHAELVFREGCRAWQSERDTPLARAFLPAIRAAGGQPRFVRKTGTSDMNVVGPRWQCPIVAYGPGDSLLDHTPDEHIVLDDYLRAIGVLRAALRRLGRAGVP